MRMGEQALGRSRRSHFPGVEVGQVPLSRRALPGGAAEHVSRPGRQFPGPPDGQPEPVEVGAASRHVPSRDHRAHPVLGHAFMGGRSRAEAYSWPVRASGRRPW